MYRYMKHDILAGELFRALRGKRSQRLLSRRLGYTSNVLYHWETGRSLPAAAALFACTRKLGRAPSACLERFLGASADWLDDDALCTDAGVAELARRLCGDTPLGVLAERMGRSRFVVSRWLGGQTVIRLPALLSLVDASSRRVLDFVAAFVDPVALPSAAAAWRLLEHNRSAAYEHPWTQAVLRALELEDYQRLARHEKGWIARRIGIDAKEEERCLEILLKAGQVRKVRGRLRAHTAQTVDTRKSPKDAERLRAFWLDVAKSCQASARPGTYAYNVCSLSLADYEKLRELHRRFFRDMQELVERSNPSERVVLLATQLIALDGSD
jgi:hypothetical protein